MRGSAGACGGGAAGGRFGPRRPACRRVSATGPHHHPQLVERPPPARHGGGLTRTHFVERIPIAVPQCNFGTHHFPATTNWEHTDSERKKANSIGTQIAPRTRDRYEAPALAGIVGFALGHVYFDIMHTLDLGVYQVVVCSALAELVKTGAGVFAGFILARRLQVATADYHRWCRRNRVKNKCRKITLRLVTGPR